MNLATFDLGFPANGAVAELLSGGPPIVCLRQEGLYGLTADAEFGECAHNDL